MFVLKQVLKSLLLPPGLWLLMLCAVLIFWKRKWARKLLLLAFLLALILHSGLAARGVGYYLESRYAPVADARSALPYDAIIVLTGGIAPAGGLITRPEVDISMFRRLDEAFRLYRQAPRPILVSGGHVDPFTPAMGENQAACDLLLRWGVSPGDVLAESASRDTFESAIQVRDIVRHRGWKRYLLVTSAAHMTRSMLVFSHFAPQPIAAPADFTVAAIPRSPIGYLPTELAARDTHSALYEYAGLLLYRIRLWFNR